jgi:hypothetical protein
MKGTATKGLYILTTPVQMITPMEFFVLDASEPLREPQDSEPIFPVPSGIAFTSQMFLPAMQKFE